MFVRETNKRSEFGFPTPLKQVFPPNVFMDGFLALGGFILIIIGLVGMLRPDALWRLYTLEPRWRKDNLEKPDDWQLKAKRHGYLYAALGVIFVLLALVLS